MLKPSEVLRNTKTPQSVGDLIVYTKYDEGKRLKTPIFEGKCSLGVLACDSGMTHLKLSLDNEWVPYETILEAYDIDDNIKYPRLALPEIEGIGWDFDNGRELSMSGIIVRLNDSYEFTFDEIAEFLEVTFDL